MDYQKKVLELINNELNNIDLSTNIEDTILENTNDFCFKHNFNIGFDDPGYIKIYLDFSRSIIHNLQKSYINNDTMKEMLLNNKLQPHQIFNYGKTSSKWKKYKEDLKIINKEKLVINPEMATSDQFYCTRCKRNTKCCYFSVQTRSSDEPMTNFITCMECNHNWRE